MSKELINALQMFADEKAMDVEDLVRAIEDAVAFAAKKRLEKENLEVVFNKERAAFELFEILTVDDGDHMGDLTPTEARAIDPDAQLGGTVRRSVEMADLGRIAAQSVRGMIHKKGKEMELIKLAGSYSRRVGEMIIAKVNNKNEDGYWFELGDLSGLLPPAENLLTDRLERGKQIRVTIVGVDSSRRTPVVTLSRSRPELLQRLMELETPELADGTVEIVAISRDNTGRSKVAVRSRKPQIDPVVAFFAVAFFLEGAFSSVSLALAELFLAVVFFAAAFFLGGLASPFISTCRRRRSASMLSMELEWLLTGYPIWVLTSMSVLLGTLSSLESS